MQRLRDEDARLLTLMDRASIAAAKVNSQINRNEWLRCVSKGEVQQSTTALSIEPADRVWFQVVRNLADGVEVLSFRSRVTERYIDYALV